LSPLSPGAQSADVDNSVTKFLKIFFDQGVMLTGVLQFDIPIDDQTLSRVRHRWREIYGGSENWDIGVLDQGGKYQRVGLTFDEMGFSDIDARNESRVVSPFGVPLTLIESRPQIVQSTYSNKQTDRQMFWEDTMVPESRLFETEYQYYLQTADGGFVAFDYSKVPALAPSRNDRIARIEKAYEMGAVLKSEYRAELGYTVEEWDNVYSIPTTRMEMSPNALADGADSATVTTGQDAGPSNLESTAGLNGAQVTAVLDVLTQLMSGMMTPLVATELLISVGIAAERAARIVAASVTGDTQPVTVESTPDDTTKPTKPVEDDNDGAAEATDDERIDQTDEKSLKAFTPDEKKRLAKQIDTLAESFEDDYRPVVDDLFEQDRREVLAIVNSVKKKHLNGNKH